MTKDDLWNRNHPRSVTLDEKQLEQYNDMVKKMNEFFKLPLDLPVVTIRIEWANGFGAEMHKDLEEE